MCVVPSQRSPDTDISYNLALGVLHGTAGLGDADHLWLLCATPAEANAFIVVQISLKQAVTLHGPLMTKKRTLPID